MGVHLGLERRRVDRGGGGRGLAVAAGYTKGVKASVFAAEEGRGARASFDVVDKLVEALARYGRLRQVVKRRRRGDAHAGTAGGERSEGRERGGGRGAGEGLWPRLRLRGDRGRVQAAFKSHGDLVQASVMLREDRDGLCTPSPVGELSIRPAREGENGRAGENNVACGRAVVCMRKRLERIVGMSVAAKR